MLDELKSIGIFAETVKQKSFSKAAKTLGLSPSVVSYHISQLEARVGNALLYRSTRNLSLTDAGETLYKHAQVMLSSAEAGISEVTLNRFEASRKLKLGIPHFLSQSSIIPHIVSFNNKYPNINFSIYCTDERQNIIQEGIDITFRIGSMDDSNMKAKIIAPIKRKLVCSPSYYNKISAVSSPHDLANKNWVSLAMLPNRREFKNEDKTIVVSYDKSTIVNSVQLMTELSVQGLGLSTPPDFLVKDKIENGKLVEVIPHWSVKDIPMYAVWPENVPRNSIIIQFLKFISEKCTNIS